MTGNCDGSLSKAPRRSLHFPHITPLCLPPKSDFVSDGFRRGNAILVSLRPLLSKINDGGGGRRGFGDNEDTTDARSESDNASRAFHQCSRGGQAWFSLSFFSRIHLSLIIFFDFPFLSEV